MSKMSFTMLDKQEILKGSRNIYFRIMMLMEIKAAVEVLRKLLRKTHANRLSDRWRATGHLLIRVNMRSSISHGFLLQLYRLSPQRLE
jgi:hypothetical protein